MKHERFRKEDIPDNPPADGAPAAGGSAHNATIKVEENNN
jgi:hypothetical protein